MATRPTQIDRVQQAQTGGGWFPSDTPGPRGTLTAQAPLPLQNALPTADLLVTVRLLRDLTAAGQLHLEQPRATKLKLLLQGLPQQSTLGPAEAARWQGLIAAQLLPTELALIEQRRLLLTRAAQNMLSRARFATPDGPVNSVQLRYAAVVPGGLTLLKQLTTEPQFNPYAHPGENATLLAQLLTALATR